MKIHHAFHISLTNEILSLITDPDLLSSVRYKRRFFENICRVFVHIKKKCGVQFWIPLTFTVWTKSSFFNFKKEGKKRYCILKENIKHYKLFVCRITCTDKADNNNNNYIY